MKDDPPPIWTSQYSGTYEDMNYGRTLAGYVMRKSHAIIEKPLSKRHFGRVLEVGAGSGIHLGYITHTYDEYTITDASDEMLSRFQHRDDTFRIITQAEDAAQLSFPNSSFDRLIATHVLEHLYKPHEALREWVRVLKPGGTLSIVLPCDPGLLWRFGRNFGPRRRAQANGLDYDYLMAREHVNSIHNLLALIRYYFDSFAEYWWPTHVPAYDLNLIYGVNITV